MSKSIKPFLKLILVFGLELLLIQQSDAQAVKALPADTLPRPLAQSAIIVRGNTKHPCVNLTAQDVADARKRIASHDWAKRERDAILKAAEPWMKESDQYWLSFLPAKGACYAYGFTGCPICKSATGTWDKALCSWDKPGHVRCEKGHVLPDAEHPDSGKGYKGPDGRIHYFVGQFNAWVTEQWTLNALPALSKAYLLTGDERYAERGMLLLDAMASIYKESTAGSWDYPSNPTSGRLARPWYQVSRTLEKFVDYYDWMYNSRAAEKPSLRPGMNRRQNIEQYMLLDGGYYCYSHGWGTLNNGNADYLRGAMTVGCLLDIPEYIDAAVNGPCSINVMLANNIDRDGWYYETTPMYSIHACHLYLSFAEPLFNLRSKEYPNGINLYDNPKMKAAITLPDLRLQLAGRRPSFGDCSPDPCYLDPSSPLFSITDYIFTEQLHSRSSDKNKAEGYGRALNFMANGNLEQMHDKNWVEVLTGKNTSDWILWHAKEPTSASASLPEELERQVKGSWAAGMKGISVLRHDKQAAFLRFGPSLNHGDPDDLGLLFSSNGYGLAYDIGYGLASTHVQVGWASSTVSHALVTVNEKNQLGGEGSGGSLLGFAALPSVQFIDADSPLSYSKEGVKVYRRSLALVKGGYLVDCFHVEGGNRHDYGFGSLGTSLQPYGVKDLKPRPGSLAEGYNWGVNIGDDGDIKGQPNKPGWNPPPGNGYGFFFNVREAKPSGKDWGGVWSISDVRPKELTAYTWNTTMIPTGEHPAKLRLHLVGDTASPVYADAPGIYPRQPLSSYVLARRSGKDLKSTFLSVYEPYSDGNKGPAPKLNRIERIGDKAIAISHPNGTIDLLLFGPHTIKSVFGTIDFKGDFAYITGADKSVKRAESLGAEYLTIAGKVLIKGKGSLTAKVKKTDAANCTVELDTEVPASLSGQTAIFSNPAWSRTSSYYINQASGCKLLLRGTGLSMGVGRVKKTEADGSFISSIPHEYARTHGSSTKFFDGKMIVGRDNGIARITSVKPNMKIAVMSGSTLKEGELFEYMDLSPGDQVHIAFPQIWTPNDKGAVAAR